MNTEMKHVEGLKLNALIQNNKTADALAHYFASRQRIRPFTDIKRLNMDLVREKFLINEDDSIEFFKALEKQGLGRYIYSRKKDGHPCFAWEYSMRKIALAAVNGTDTYVERIAQDKTRIQDGPRRKRKMNIGYPVKIAVAAHIKKQETIKEVDTKINALTPPVEIQINGQTLMAISQHEYNQLMKVKELLTAMK